MSRQWWIVAGLVGVLAGLIGVGWIVRDRFLPVEVGTTAPSFTARDLSGRPVSLDDLRGEVVLLNIWATWCPPCRDEMPSMQRLYEQLGPEGLKVVAVSIDAANGAIDASGHAGGNIGDFAREFGLTFTIWHDPSAAVQRIYRATAVPESFVIDRSGYITRKVIGATEWDSEASIESFRRLLRER
jgi:cytochrome c biogenesis protein CcmG, thiol:disulfide interchange protein DsbE